jgi:(p)ppGpp synthase/HD superfamily hydrolase
LSELVDKAKALATDLHKGHLRKFSRAAYIFHPHAVSFYLRTHGYNRDDNLIAAAWLHDLLEDTNYTLEQIVDNFNNDVALLVYEVTHPNVIGNRSVRWQADLEHYSGASARGKALKMSDRICNLTDYWYDWDMLTAGDKKFLKDIYLPESRQLCLALQNADVNLGLSLESIIDFLEDL